MDKYELNAIGVLRSEAVQTSDLPLGGCSAQVHVFPEFSRALKGIEEHSHLIVLFWLHQADRTLLEVQPRRIPDLPEKGVFGLRSPVRPNPIALCVSPLVKKEGNVIHVDYIDVIDGTPVIDIKPYVPAWECIQSARSDGEPELLLRMKPDEAMADFLRQAKNFHGSVCVGGAIGARAAYAALRFFKDNLRDKELKITCDTRACIADAIQGITGAGLKRLKKGENKERIVFVKNGRELKLRITSRKFKTVDEVLAKADEEIFLPE